MPGLSQSQQRDLTLSKLSASLPTHAGEGREPAPFALWNTVPAG